MTTRASRDVLGRGLRVLGRAIRTEPRLFAIGTVSRRISSYGQAIRELDKLADRPKA